MMTQDDYAQIMRNLKPGERHRVDLGNGRYFTLSVPKDVNALGFSWRERLRMRWRWIRAGRPEADVNRWLE